MRPTHEDGSGAGYGGGGTGNSRPQGPGAPAPQPDGSYSVYPYQGLGDGKPVPAKRSPRSRGILVSGVLAFVLGGAGLLLPAQYVVESPGPTFNTLGTAGGKDIIQIEGERSYPTDGELDLTTVYVAGGPSTNISIFHALGGWVNTNDVVYPADFLYAPGTTGEQVDEENAAAMTSSQESAVAAALTLLEIPYTQELSVGSVVEGAPAEGVLQAGDTVLAVGDTPVDGIDTLRSALNDAGGSPVDVTVRRGGSEVMETLTPRKSDSGVYQLGIELATTFDFPFEVRIGEGMDRVGGPSAGMMFALGIVDRLTPEQLTGGRHFAGTGTIDAAGNVGPIGGIRQKLIGASDAGAEFFLAPEANCAEVVDHIPEGLAVVKVSTLDEARDAVEKLAAGTNPADLPQCSL
ncbi:PDZ domain-containing protein [Arthrobacter sp. zg-Y20]|uniref:YlbL family protein n=1 Tax=unclassified Arthrobacter TaxID=235627 RepID=UPI001D13F111|nr:MULTISPECIES: S16 family serine protease [unclassified Arthrobacter]MCC3276803.1 PDZ domain-containing protein [Arthrobacter sp. zg-Y20]MDK1316962.1 S16 family serine protease [Arthrobacter sp. zg.Y20]WIB05323.1 S16 family serine protease [Arthrobacter sp. zg-Y20]